MLAGTIMQATIKVCYWTIGEQILLLVSVGEEPWQRFAE